MTNDGNATRGALPQFNDKQQQAALTLIEQLPWADVEGGLRAMEDALRRALQATTDDFGYWEDELGPLYEQEGWSEFDLPTEVVEALRPHQKLAYVARLLRSLAMAYGVSVDYGRLPHVVVGQDDRNSPATLLRGLNDILWLEG